MKYDPADLTVSESTGFPSLLTGTTARGWSIYFISRSPDLTSSISLPTLSPPQVEPAHEPTNISTTRRVWENTGHWVISAVAKPVEVIVDETMKNE